MAEPTENALVPSTAAPRRRLERIFAPEKVNRQPNLSIPGAVFYDMIRNPKFPGVWEKLMQTCKYPFSKNKLLPVEGMNIQGNTCMIRVDREEDRYIEVDLKKMPFKLWLCYRLDLNDTSGFDSNLFLSHVSRSDLQSLRVRDIIGLELYQKLIASGSLRGLDVEQEIQASDGSPATVDQILRPLSNLTHLWWDFDDNSSIKTVEDVKQFVKIAGKLPKLEMLVLCAIPEGLFSTFVDFFKKNKTIDMRLCIYDFSEDYIQMIEDFMEEMIENPPEKIPHIYCNFDDFDPDVVEEYLELVPGYDHELQRRYQ